jgi:uncharacterized membrane protein
VPPGYISFPLVTAFMYAVATIILKRALQDGTGGWRVTLVCNMVMALGYQGCWVMRTQPFNLHAAMWAVAAGCVFFAGQVFTFVALSRGDVSVVTPVLGTKVIWVAMFAVLLAQRTLSAHLWLAVALTAAGTAVLGYQPGAHPRRLALSLGASLATSCSFAMTDVMVLEFAPGWGFGSFVPTMFLTVGVLSLGLIQMIDGEGWAPVWLGPGSVVLAAQALGMAYAIATYGHVTTINIMYSSRGLWSVGMVWVVGHWFGNTERDQGHRAMLLRLCGAGLILTAIFIASG